MLALALAAIELAVLTVLTTHVVSLKPTDWGLVSVLPPLYWVGLLTIPFLMYIGRKSTAWMAFNYFLTIAYLHVVPTLILANPRTPSSYYPAAEAITIAGNGHIIPHSQFGLLSYGNWPGSLVLVSTLLTVTKAPLLEVIKYTPLVMLVVFGLVLFASLRTELPRPQALQGSILFAAGLGVYEGYFQPQGIAFLLFLGFFLLLTFIHYSPKKRNNLRVFLVLAIFFFLAIVPTHLLTTIFAILGLAALYIFRNRLSDRTVSATLLVALVAAVIVYNANAPDFRALVAAVNSNFSNLPTVLTGHMARIETVGSALQILTNAARVMLGVVVGAATLLAALQIIRKKMTRRYGYWLVWILGFIFLGALSSYASLGGGEMIIRFFLFALIPATFLSVRFLGHKQKTILVLLTVLLILHIPAHYGGDSYKIVTDSQLKGSEFYALDVPSDSSYFAVFYQKLIYAVDPLNVKAPTRPPLWTGNVAASVASALKQSRYVIDTDLDRNALIYYSGQDPMENVDIDNFMNRIYDSGSYRIHINLRAP